MQSNELERIDIIHFLSDLFERRGAESYLGERVSMSEHMLQSARNAERSGAPDSLIVAALLHDVGHYTGEFPEDALEKGIDNNHEELGARFLAHFFPTSVTEPIRLHVKAKRYLCAVDPDCFARLTPASVQSMNVQGGPMTLGEVSEFEGHRDLEAALALRRFDDAAKTPGIRTPDFAHYRPLLDALRHGSPRSPA